MDAGQRPTSRRTRRRALALGVGVTLVAGAAIVAVDLAGAPQASASASLEPFSDCEELLSWYREATEPDVTAYGLGGGRDTAMPASAGAEVALESMGGADSAAGGTDEAASAVDAVGSSDTGTNVQEAGVDEPSRIKVADGVAYSLAGSRLVAVDVTGGEVLGDVDLAPALPRADDTSDGTTDDTGR